MVSFLSLVINLSLTFSWQPSHWAIEVKVLLLQPLKLVLQLESSDVLVA